MLVPLALLSGSLVAWLGGYLLRQRGFAPPLLWLQGSLLLAGSTALALLHVYRHPYNLLELSQSLLLFYLLVPLSFIDCARLEVDARLVAGGIFLRFASLFLFAPQQVLTMSAGMLVGAGLFTMVSFFYQTLRGRVGLGEGDTALMGLLGAFVGWQGVLPCTALAAAGGLVVGLPLLLWRGQPLGSPIPFVPFLAAAALAVRLLMDFHIPLPGLLGNQG